MSQPLLALTRCLLDSPTFVRTVRSAADKRIRRLKDLLKPDSDVHRKQSENELRSYVREVAALADELPAAVTQDIDWDLKTAVKAIVQAPRPHKLVKVRTPSLIG